MAPTPAKRNETDADTVLLLHLDNRRGPFVPDASGRGAHGVLRNRAGIERVAFCAGKN